MSGKGELKPLESQSKSCEREIVSMGTRYLSLGIRVFMLSIATEIIFYFLRARVEKPSTEEEIGDSLSGKTEANQPDYDVAISFAGEDREHAEQIAELVDKAGYRVFLDTYEKAQLWGKNLYPHLLDVYQNRARYCLILISQHYKANLWTKHELDAAQARAFRENREYILPLRLDSTRIPGIPDTVGYIDLRSTKIAEVVDLLMEKLRSADSNS